MSKSLEKQIIRNFKTSKGNSNKLSIRKTIFIENKFEIIQKITEWVVMQILEQPFRICSECRSITTSLFCNSCLNRNLEGSTIKESQNRLSQRIGINHPTVNKYIKKIEPILSDPNFYPYNFSYAPQEMAEFFTNPDFYPYSTEEFVHYLISKQMVNSPLYVGKDLPYEVIHEIVSWVLSNGLFLDGRFLRKAMEEFSLILRTDYQTLANWRRFCILCYQLQGLSNLDTITTYLFENKEKLDYLNYNLGP